jgi:hypothetical protein
MIAKIVTHPIDTIKAKLQVSRVEMKTISSVKFGSALDIGKICVLCSQEDMG